MRNDYKASSLNVDDESVLRFINLTKKEEWTGEDLDAFTASRGIQYLIQQEKESGPNSSEDAVKTFLKKVHEGCSGEQGGWTKAFKEKATTQKNLCDLRENLLECALSVVKSYLPAWAALEGTLYFLPGGSREIYSGLGGIAVNLACESAKAQLTFLTAREAYNYAVTCLIGEKPSLEKCTTPSEFLEAFLTMTQREGTATFVGLKAAGMVDQFYQEHLIDMKKKKQIFGNSFRLAMDGKAKENLDTIKDLFSDHTSLCALFGFAMAKALDDYDDYVGHPIGRDALLSSVQGQGYISFFEVYRVFDEDFSLLPEVVWETFEMVKKEKGVRLARENGFFLG